MNNKSEAEILSDGVYQWNSLHDIPTSTLLSFLGVKNMIDDKKVNIIFGIYIGLIKHKNISLALLQNCYLSNRLDELIEKKYTHNKSGYFSEFKRMKINIGNTHVNGSLQLFPDEIKSDDYCPYCDHEGFITNFNFKNIDCPKCFIFVCKYCAVVENGCYVHNGCLD